MNPADSKKTTLAGQIQQARAAWFDLLADVVATWPKAETLKRMAREKAARENRYLQDYE